MCITNAEELLAMIHYRLSLMSEFDLSVNGLLRPIFPEVDGEKPLCSTATNQATSLSTLEILVTIKVQPSSPLQAWGAFLLAIMACHTHPPK